MVGELRGKMPCDEKHDILEENLANIKWRSVRLSEIIRRGKRLEASVFDINAKRARESISGNGFDAKSVCGKNGIASAYTCARFKRLWVKHSAYPIFQPHAIVDIMPKPDGYISPKTNVDIDSLRVQKGQILMTCSGTIGKVAYVSRTLDNKIFSHDLLRINCFDPEDAGYLYTYLKSKTGNQILVTNNYGAVISHIEAKHLENVPIPYADKKIRKRINDLISDSYELRDESNELIMKAEKMLLDELRIESIDQFTGDDFNSFDYVETFNVKLSDMKGRLDASYHIPIAGAIIRHLEENASELTTLGDERVSRGIILAGIFKRTYVDEEYGYPFLGGRDISQLMPETEKYLSRSIHKKRYEEELKVSENTILVTDRGTVGTTMIVPRHWENCAVSQNVLKLVPANNEIAGYIFIFLNSKIGECLIKRQTYGSVVDMIDSHRLASVEIPFLKNSNTQQAINNLALEANRKRYGAFVLEKKALQIFEKEVLTVKRNGNDGFNSENKSE